METRIFVVHLPQYFQVEEDFTGTGRLTAILCKIYGLPGRLEDRERGIDQYASLQNMVAGTTEVSSLLQRLEERYDRENSGPAAPTKETPPLSPQVEAFLHGLDQDFVANPDPIPEVDADDDPNDE